MSGLPGLYNKIFCHVKVAQRIHQCGSYAQYHQLKRLLTGQLPWSNVLASECSHVAALYHVARITREFTRKQTAVERVCPRRFPLQRENIQTKTYSKRPGFLKAIRLVQCESTSVWQARIHFRAKEQSWIRLAASELPIAESRNLWLQDSSS